MMNNFIKLIKNNIGYIIFILALGFIIYNLFLNISEKKIEKRIKDSEKKIHELEIEVEKYKTTSEIHEKESKDLKKIIDNSKENNVTNIINKYNEKSSTVSKLNDDESILFLSRRLHQKNNP